jgi:NAD(P)-dependent dehydrogenase (short-subunit alcohol dehydrogenase family)
VELDGRVAVVTGAAAGTGRAIAHRLGAEGALVVVADVDAERGEDTARAIEADGGRAGFVRTDVTDSGDVRAMVALAEQGRGGPHVLVNNAGGGGHVEPHFPDATPGQWGATLDLNLRGAMLATHLVFERIRAAGGGAEPGVSRSAAAGPSR